MGWFCLYKHLYLSYQMIPFPPNGWLLKLKQHIHSKQGMTVNLCELLHQKTPGCFSGRRLPSCPLQVDSHLLQTQSHREFRM